MATPANPMALAGQARRIYSDHLLKSMPALSKAIDSGSRQLLVEPATSEVMMRRRQDGSDLLRVLPAWQAALTAALRNGSLYGVSTTRPGELPPTSLRAVGSAGLTLVDNDTIEVEILASRLALAVMDKAGSEFTDLRQRMAQLERREELDTHDLLRAHVLARMVVDAWRGSGLGLGAWRTFQSVVHEEFSLLVEEAYHECNRWLAERKVLPEVDLRPMIRRSPSAALPTLPGGFNLGMPGGGPPVTGFQITGAAPFPGAGVPAQGGNHGGRQGVISGGMATAMLSGLGNSLGNAVGDETRMMTRGAGLQPHSDHAEAVLGRLNRLVGRQLPDFANTAPHRPASPPLRAAMGDVQRGLQQRMNEQRGTVTTPVLLEQLHQTKQALKQAASTPVERATIEIVALLFQSILTEERLPATVRVWFARLQMPVLRVAVGEPDFFATIDHPARRLIDRMGACVMGFDASARAVGDALQREIKRIVQVVEAYPDTGRRVFQTVLTEFERFLEHYFKNENEASRKGISLAQQVEQRETLAIQYTIELRKMLNEVPVQDAVRSFLFQVWADVLAMAAVKSGLQSDDTKAMKRAAADLIWSASAKVSRDERAEVIRRLPVLLKTLRDGMASAGMAADRQDEYIQTLNNSLAAAFTAKAAAIPSERLDELMERLETLEELLPDAADLEIDESMVLDLSGHESSELEVVAEGGSMPTPAMVAWARELQVGSWYMLDFRERNEAVQLVWQGMRRQLCLFVSAQGRGVLFQQNRLAAFLQAGLLLPAQDEALTVRATRSALAKLDVDPGRLLN